MTIYLTQKQYDMLAKMVPIMLEFYKNDIRPLFEEIGRQYGTQTAVDTACEIFKAVPVTGQVPKYIKALTWIEDCVKNAENIHIQSSEKTKNDPFVKKVFIPNTKEYPTNRDVLVDALDTYSRVLMGQFSVIYEQLDIDSSNPRIQEAWASAKWNGSGVYEMRDLLIPDLIRMGWNGSYGIASPDNRRDSKLAYEMLKRIRNRRDDYILRVTDQPLIIVEEF